MPDDVRSLYRRYRSRTFSELIGQDHVSRTLLNALETGRLGHAYLFAGPRGSGKTSTARILAKAVSCLTNEGRGEPCNACEMCVAINEGRALDLIEIDAASNRGIDEIRDLRDKVHFAPTMARYKVYILDEAHMLTNEAFNALLKTLEEPPPHVIFALVTTEAHRIPPTILSRCQRFDFHRASTQDVLSKLQHICREESIRVEPAALILVARAATGSYRDGESLLDQLASFTGPDGVTLQYVQQVLGLAPADAASRLVTNIVQHDVSAGLQLLAEIMQGGVDLRQFGRDLVDYLRNLVLLKTSNEALLDTTAEAVDGMRAQAQKLALPELVRLLRLFSDPDVANGLRASTQPQLPLELAFMQACAAPEPTPRTAASEPMPRAAAPVSAPPAQPAAHNPVPPTPAVAERPAQAGRRPATTQPTRPAYDAAARRPVGASGVSAGAARPAPPAGQPAVPASPPRAATPARPQIQVTVTAPPGTPLANVQQYWAALLEAVKNSSRSAEAFLKECRPLEADEENVVLGFFYDFHRGSVDNPKNRALVEEAFSKVLAHPVHIRCTLTPKDGAQASGGSSAGGRAGAPSDSVVRAAAHMFKGTVLAVEETTEK